MYRVSIKTVCCVFNHVYTIPKIKAQIGCSITTSNNELL